jgi:hypothetical protein
MTADETGPAVFQHGSTWVRADFHMHTRADKEFDFEGESNSFVASYVAALKTAGIQVAVITNHNKFDHNEFKAIKKGAWKEEILLLPGIELSVKDGSHGIHTLVVFHPDWIENQENDNYIQSFLSVTFAGQANFENENGRSNHDLNDTIRELDKYGRDYFLVFAHVEADNGLWGGLSGGRLTELSAHDPFRQRSLGFQKVRTRDKQEKAKTHFGKWYPAEVDGCDCKSLAEIGKGNKTFLKIGAFAFESVKFALLDHRNRVRDEPPKREHSFIKRIAFEGGGKLGGTSIDFSPQLNTFIGIRGSGKSTILEAIRYVLDIPFGKNSADREYKEGSLRNGLESGGKITLTAMDRHGREYEVRRILGEHPDVYVGGTLHPGISIRETVVHKPIYFGQKDLSNTGQGFENDLVEKLVGEKLIETRAQISSQRQEVTEVIRRLQKLADVAEKQKEYESKKQDAEFRLRVFKEQGVEEKLQKQIDYEQDARTMKDLREFVTGYLQELEEFVARYSDEFASRKKYESKQNPEFFREVFAIFGRVFSGFQEICKTAEFAKVAASELKGKVTDFDALKNSLKEEFAEVSRNLSELLKLRGSTAIEPDEFLKLRKSIENAKQILTALAREKEQQLSLKLLLTSELTKLNDYWHQEFTHIKRELDVINAQKTALQIEVQYKGDKEAFLKYVKDLFRGSKLREATLCEVVQKFADGAAIYRDLEKVKEMLGASAATFEQYFTDNLSALLTWQVPNRFTIKYHEKPLKNHSIGQRASALILFVLSQRDNDVVMIDQPEDDLDNQTIFEDVVKLVRRLKPETQFLFATHNPNIPVLGDAEQIVACAYDEPAIQITVGSIDCPVLQKKIVSIMEGGSKAFQRRKEIYQGWKQ